MQKYYTYNGVVAAFSLLKHAALQGKYFTNLQLQKLTYVSHGLSLAHFQRPLIIDDVYAWQYGPVVPSVYFRFKSHGAKCIEERDDPLFDSLLDAESEGIVRDVVRHFGDLSGAQLVELTHREGSPWHEIWDGTHHKIIPDEVICAHYLKIQKAGHTNSL